MPAARLIESRREKDSTRSSLRAPVLWPWLLVILGWAILVWAALAHQTFLLDHQYLLRASGLPWVAAFEIFLFSWQVMTVAIMLPPSMPVMKLVVYAGRSRERPRAVPLAFLAGYAVIWTAFAAGAFLGDTLVHGLVALWPWLAIHSWLIGAVTFFVAGLFQFSSLKGRCLDLCHVSPSCFKICYRGGVNAAWNLGLRHGRYCLGSCWALMLVMFGVGIGNLAGMAALTGAMMIEKNAPSGKRFSPFIGVVLLSFGVLWLAHPFWLQKVGV